MRIALDATPLLGRRTGVGRYVAGLASELVAAAAPDPLELVLAAFTWRGAKDVPPLGGGRVAGRRVPARLLQATWSRSELPPVEWLTGRVDIVHGTNFVLPPVRRAAGVLTVHDLSYELHSDTVTAASRRYQQLVPQGLRRAAVVTTMAEATADDLADFYHLDRSRIVITPLGVDPVWGQAAAPDAAWRARHGLPARYLVFVGTPEPRKNLPVLLAAHRLARARDPEVPPLVLVGPAGWGPQAPVEGDGAAVVRTGYLEEPDVARVVAGAAALVLPSRYEGFGLPPLEAMACGTAVVASDLPVVREVTGGLAELVPVGDVEALAAALAKVLDDDGGPAARAARRAHAARFTWRRCAEQAFRAYRLALA